MAGRSSTETFSHDSSIDTNTQFHSSVATSEDSPIAIQQGNASLYGSKLESFSQRMTESDQTQQIDKSDRVNEFSNSNNEGGQFKNPQNLESSPFPGMGDINLSEKKGHRHGSVDPPTVSIEARARWAMLASLAGVSRANETSEHSRSRRNSRSQLDLSTEYDHREIEEKQTQDEDIMSQSDQLKATSKSSQSNQVDFSSHQYTATGDSTALHNYETDTVKQDNPAVDASSIERYLHSLEIDPYIDTRGLKEGRLSQTNSPEILVRRFERGGDSDLMNKSREKEYTRNRDRGLAQYREKDEQNPNLEPNLGHRRVSRELREDYRQYENNSEQHILKDEHESSLGLHSQVRKMDEELQGRDLQNHARTDRHDLVGTEMGTEKHRIWGNMHEREHEIEKDIGHGAERFREDLGSSGLQGLEKEFQNIARKTHGAQLSHDLQQIEHIPKKRGVSNGGEIHEDSRLLRSREQNEISLRERLSNGVLASPNMDSLENRIQKVGHELNQKYEEGIREAKRGTHNLENLNLSQSLQNSERTSKVQFDMVKANAQNKFAGLNMVQNAKLGKQYLEEKLQHDERDVKAESKAVIRKVEENKFSSHDQAIDFRRGVQTLSDNSHISNLESKEKVGAMVTKVQGEFASTSLRQDIREGEHAAKQNLEKGADFLKNGIEHVDGRVLAEKLSGGGRLIENSLDKLTGSTKFSTKDESRGFESSKVINSREGREHDLRQPDNKAAHSMQNISSPRALPTNVSHHDPSTVARIPPRQNGPLNHDSGQNYSKPPPNPVQGNNQRHQIPLTPIPQIHTPMGTVSASTKPMNSAQGSAHPNPSQEPTQIHRPAVGQGALSSQGPPPQHRRPPLHHGIAPHQTPPPHQAIPPQQAPPPHRATPLQQAPPPHQAPPLRQGPTPHQAPPLHQGPPPHQATPLQQAPPPHQAPPLRQGPTPHQAPPLHQGPPPYQATPPQQAPPPHQALPLRQKPPPHQATPLHQGLPPHQGPQQGQRPSLGQAPSSNQTPQRQQEPPSTQNSLLDQRVASGQKPLNSEGSSPGRKAPLNEGLSVIHRPPLGQGSSPGQILPSKQQLPQVQKPLSNQGFQSGQRRPLDQKQASVQGSPQVPRQLPDQDPKLNQRPPSGQVQPPAFTLSKPNQTGKLSNSAAGYGGPYAVKPPVPSSERPQSTDHGLSRNLPSSSHVPNTESNDQRGQDPTHNPLSKNDWVQSSPHKDDYPLQQSRFPSVISQQTGQRANQTLMTQSARNDTGPGPHPRDIQLDQNSSLGPVSNTSDRPPPTSFSENFRASPRVIEQKIGQQREIEGKWQGSVAEKQIGSQRQAELQQKIPKVNQAKSSMPLSLPISHEANTKTLTSFDEHVKRPGSAQASPNRNLNVEHTKPHQATIETHSKLRATSQTNEKLPTQDTERKVDFSNENTQQTAKINLSETDTDKTQSLSTLHSAPDHQPPTSTPPAQSTAITGVENVLTMMKHRSEAAVQAADGSPGFLDQMIQLLIQMAEDAMPEIRRRLTANQIL